MPSSEKTNVEENTHTLKVKTEPANAVAAGKNTVVVFVSAA